MRFGRTIVVMLVAFAVAVLPAVGGAVRAAAVAAESAVMVAQHCNHAGQPSSGKERQSTDGCDSLAACAAKCFNFAGLASCDVSYVPAGAVPVTMSAAPTFVSHTDPPPFPPPRV